MATPITHASSVHQTVSDSRFAMAPPISKKKYMTLHHLVKEQKKTKKQKTVTAEEHYISFNTSRSSK